jgi:hypothetical protein
MLRDQARTLRQMAESFDNPQTKEDLLNLATRCDQLATRIAREISERLQQPISGARDPSG